MFSIGTVRERQLMDKLDEHDKTLTSLVQAVDEHDRTIKLERGYIDVKGYISSRVGQVSGDIAALEKRLDEHILRAGQEVEARNGIYKIHREALNELGDKLTEQNEVTDRRFIDVLEHGTKVNEHIAALQKNHGGQNDAILKTIKA